MLFIVFLQGNLLWMLERVRIIKTAVITDAYQTPYSSLLCIAFALFVVELKCARCNLMYCEPFSF